MQSSKSVNSRIGLLSLLILASMASIAGCGFVEDVFDDQGDDDDTSTSGDGDGDDTDDPIPPREGFRVFPKYLLQDVPAVVTIERDAVPYDCPLDVDGGYVCDATAMPAGPVPLTIERDGFDVAVRNPELVPEQIPTLEVHLSPAGGPTGTWSACVPAGSFATCGDVCSNEMLACVVTSCATGQDEYPIATLATFSDAECVTSFENIASTCNDPLPIGAAAALRCCCEMP
jgi:hypothetical protein